MTKRPALSGRGTAGDALRAAARNILSEARAAIEDRDRAEAEAVHDFRKAMKRWRALLRLLRPFLGQQARRLGVEARDTARALARPRDAQSALDGLDEALKQKNDLSPRSIATIRERLNGVRRKAEAAVLTEVTRARIARMLRRAASRVSRWNLSDLSFQDIAARLTQTYRRARKMVPKDWAAAGAEELHELRQRVVEHRYQMELVEPLWPRLGKVWVEEAQRLRERLGSHQDLEVLEKLIAPHQLLSPWRSRLAPLVAERKRAHVAAAARLCGRLFAERPKAFRRRLEAMWQARVSTRFDRSGANVNDARQRARSSP